MKPRAKKIGFTIIELLTVMSIIVVLIGILVPSMNAVRRYSKVVAQKNQFHDISKCLESFNVEYDGYPDSSAKDANDESYCGAMKLCEAMVGQDGLGFHPDSIFLAAGLDADGEELYFVKTGNELDDPPTAPQQTNLRNRWKCFEGENVQIASLVDIWPVSISPFTSEYEGWAVLCDVFKRNDLRNAKDDKLGMPILYYRADPTQLTHQYDEMATNIYRYSDNHDLLGLEVPWALGTYSPLFDPNVTTTIQNGGERFYELTTNPNVVAQWGGTGGIYPQPYNKNSFILISAGWDGLYGTKDDVFNFENKK